jgi:hypothetical protein
MVEFVNHPEAMSYLPVRGGHEHRVGAGELLTLVDTDVSALLRARSNFGAGTQ